MVAADHLGEVADHLIGHFVDQARRSGASWTDIGRSMGVTKQAAQQAVRPQGPRRRPDLDADQGFSRFTPRARNAVMAAHNDGPRGRARRDPARAPRPRPAHRARSAGRQGDRRQRRHARRRPRGRTAALPPAAGEAPELVPYGPAAKKVLELTFREALRLGHNYIGTEHILLALVEVEDGDGVLTALGVDQGRRSRRTSSPPSSATRSRRSDQSRRPSSPRVRGARRGGWRPAAC